MVVCWDILSNWKKYLSSTVGLAIGIVIMYLLVFQSYRAELRGVGKIITPETMTTIMEGCGDILIPMAVIALFALAANIFNNMRNKLQREAFLMLPASNIEKYLSRLFGMTIGGLVMIFVATVISDVIIFIFNSMFASGCYSSLTIAGLKALFEGSMNAVYVNGELQNSMSKAFTAWTFFIFTHSFFTLGGAFFRKRPVVLTFCVGLLLCVFFMFGTVEGLAPTIEQVFDGSPHLFGTIILIMLLILTVFNYWASYKLFTRMQVISNKWINL